MALACCDVPPPRSCCCRSIERRNPYIDVLSYLQLELLRRRREGRVPDREQKAVDSAIQLTINGIAAGLRNTG